ncbi:glycine betaine/L-proline transporter ProP [Streptomyces sp. SID3343]|uniref:glycine betaine/L-proline transporter ProP n=1 Tax=Streptomyces sp. SID3343 TaxID=2690260 RepID=UPI00136B0235|nr:glycine betaine/L-proline transporter ProP [Streptomyces sp. SID3343]
MSTDEQPEPRRHRLGGRRRKRLREQDITVVDTATVDTAVKATMLGNAMEWYDFGIYAYMAVTIGKVFFPSGNDTAQTLASFATFAAAFVVRPLGGFFFGPLGDRIGRKKVLATTMLMMATGTLCIGLIPSYASIGYAAPILLILFRMIQGFSAGGEYGGASTFIAEYAPDKRRGFYGSFLEFGTLIGYICAASLVTLLTAVLGDHRMLQWGWRIPFLVAAPIGVVGLYLRLRLEESPAFTKVMDKAAEPGGDSDAKPGPMAEFKRIFLGQKRPMIICIALVAAYNINDYMLLSYMPTYLSDTLDYNETHGLLLIVVVMIVLLGVIHPLGSLTDRIGRRPVIIGGCVGFLVLPLPCFVLIRMGALVPIFVGLMILGLVLVCFLATMSAALPALFPTEIRSGALSVSFNISVSAFGGTTPFVTEALVSGTGNGYMPAFYMMLAAAVGLVAAIEMSETARQPLMGSPPAVETAEEARELAATQG